MLTVIDAKAVRLWEQAPPMQRRKMLEWGTRLAQEPFLGTQIQKARFPKWVGEVTNLWRLPLPEGWRVLYTVEGLGESVTRVVILWIGNHKAYDRLFGYHTS